jgi:alpha-L-fucosidase
VGVAFHFSMSSFTSNDYDQGTEPDTMYDPTTLDLDRWLAGAELIGTQYAILDAKSMSGFCL